MLRYALMAVGGAVVVALALVILPVYNGPRQQPKILTAPGDAQSSTSFTIGAAPPPAPVPAPVPAPAAPAAAPAPAQTAANGATPSTSDLDALMAKLRAGSTPAPTGPDATVTGTPPSAAPATAPSAPAGAGSVPPAPAAPAPVPAAVPSPDQPPAPPPAPRWGSVTAQGTRWRISKSPGGYTVSIDLGNGQVADVHVLPAFANLDPAAINVRVDYLRDTILANFSSHSASYVFARDGSVSLER
jgi:hypothetical protein